MSGTAGVDTCPICDGAMRLRTNRATDEQFYGCARYPDCIGTRKFDGEGDETRSDRSSLPSERQRRNDRRRWDA
jgi:ssDNA-binding Zn-finger/Zn-ribbon topoisomerase 1